MSYKTLLYIACLCWAHTCPAQQCDFSIQGRVRDEASGAPLAFADVATAETNHGTVTDEKGFFSLGGLCPGAYRIVVSYMGYETEAVALDLRSDTTLVISLFHEDTPLETVMVTGRNGVAGRPPQVAIHRCAIGGGGGGGMSDLLVNEAGVHAIKNGGGISKPIVHGLYGNRLAILNNGVAQSGQQWGNDHAPEIDPFVADEIKVLKGASAIEYGGGNLGSLVLVAPQRIPRDTQPRVQVNYGFSTNGRGHALNVRLEQYDPKLAWRISGTVKKSGDRKTARYFLNNTGAQEANLALQLEKSWDGRLFFEAYASTFNTRLGVLRGGHIGNLTDLGQAMERHIPFFTEPRFSYGIDAPMQRVSHHLVKLKARYLPAGNQQLEWVLAGQMNDRKEFDVRRGGRSGIPSLSLVQYAINADVKYTRYLARDWILRMGAQNILTDNTNQPGTGVLPLIPDYISWKWGNYATLFKVWGSLDASVGARYDFQYLNAITISRGVPKEIIRFDRRFHSFGALLALQYDISERHSLAWNMGYATRPPGVNELYSGGLHQGVSGIEEGDIHLETERAVKNTLEYQWRLDENLSFSALAYHQRFNGYIYLAPQDEIRLTIRGAFPVFRYKQTGACIYGLDLSARFHVLSRIFGQLKYSYLRGDDRSEGRPLVYMPPNRWHGRLSYRFGKAFALSSNAKMEGLELELDGKWVSRQRHIGEGQDFAPPPSAYFLLGAKVAANVTLPKYRFRCFAQADNILNVSYRDYLNRQRYFADDLGWGLSLGIGVGF